MIRNPYVGEGADGARRSAAIDRSEADGLDLDDPRHGQLLTSAMVWDEQADQLERAAQQGLSATERTCPVAVEQRGPGDNTTHHLIPSYRRDRTVMVCRYCKRTQAQIEGPA